LQKDAPFLEPSFIRLSKSPVKEMPICRAFSTYPSGYPAREPFLHRAPTERDAPPPEPLSTISQSPHEMSPLPGSPVGPLWKEMPITRVVFYITFRFLNKGGPQPLLVPFTERPWREISHFQRPLSTITIPSERSPHDS